MKIEILDGAKDDLIAGFHFYEEQSPRPRVILSGLTFRTSTRERLQRV